MQVSVVCPPAVRAGVLLCVLGVIAGSSAWAQGAANDAAKPATEQSAAPTADKPAEQPSDAGKPAAAAEPEKTAEKPAEPAAVDTKPVQSTDSASPQPADKVSTEKTATDVAAESKPAEAKSETKVEPNSATDVGQKPAVTESKPAEPAPAVQPAAVAKDAPAPEKLEGKAEEKAAESKPAAAAPAEQPATAAEAKPAVAPAEPKTSEPPAAAPSAAVPQKAAVKQDTAAPSAKPERHGKANAHAHHAEDDAKPAKRKLRARSKPESEAKRGGVNCKSFRTYDAEKGTYRGYDGRVHTCS
ncbi:hypothetical protein ACQR0Y_04545 [Bradyrhizobium oligotrophicum]|uniref:hypothetical protein n=1 Tax=Bradyrhizobium TaxID=374 RepID=UPI002916633A|nr:hypothetical protein [Bradyrhizobium sp. SZCCHNRI1009]